MSPRCLPSSFGSIWLMVWEETSFEEFHGGHFGYRNRTTLAILNLCVTVMPPIKFLLNPTNGMGGDVVWRISRWPPWRPSWIKNGTILTILNLCVALMILIKFWLNLTYGLGGDIVWRISRWPPWQPSWISERNDFSNSKSLCHCDASHRFGSIWLMVWEKLSFELFQDGGHLGCRNGTILAILNLYVATMPPS